MSLKLIPSKNRLYKVKGEIYAKDYYKDKSHIDDIINLRKDIRDQFDKLIYTEVLLTKREESLRREEMHLKNEQLYNEFIESLKRVREEKKIN
tara:strand:- start:671 stop:949 length:279 start_codon:yes stop_codon:yes gene_type:complete